MHCKLILSAGVGLFLMQHLTLSVEQRDQVKVHFKTASSQQSLDLNSSYDSGSV